MTQEIAHNTVVTTPVHNREEAKTGDNVLLQQEDGSIVIFPVLDVANGRLRVKPGVFWKDTGYEFRQDNKALGRRIVNPTADVLAKIEQQNARLQKTITPPEVTSAKPIQPDQVEKIDVEAKAVIIWNKLIKAKWDGLNAVISQGEVIRELSTVFSLPEDVLIKLNIWNIEQLYKEAGWDVKYQKMYYSKTTDNYYTFTPAQEHTEEDIPF